MSWTVSTREKYARKCPCYASDMTDEEWALIEPHMPQARRLGRPRKTDMREADVLTGQGQTVTDVIRQLGVSDVTYYRWRKEYGGLRIDQAKQLKDLEKENARLKRLLADAELDKSILKEAASGNF